MKKIILLSLLFIAAALSQEFKVRQVLSIPGADCRNFSSPDPFNWYSLFVFEADFGAKTSIFLGKYNPEADTFIVLRNLTDNNFRNLNGIFITTLSDSLNYLVYQTNQNGNWDIAYIKFSEYYTSEPTFLTNTPMDETNPRTDPIPLYDNSRYIVYNFNNISGIGVGFTSLGSNVPNTIIFSPGESNFYYEPIVMKDYSGVIRVMASVDSSDSRRHLIYREYDNGSWSNTKVLLHDTVSFLNRCAVEYSGLTYSARNRFTGKFSIYAHGDISDTLRSEIVGDTVYDYYDLHTGYSGIITKNNLIHYPFGYQAVKDRKHYIAFPNVDVIIYGYPQAMLVPVKTNGSSLSVSRLGINMPGEVFYTIWQDSADGKIQLFGKKTILHLDAVYDKLPETNFLLSQNYPNPFNPATTIKYTIKKAGDVKLTVIDVLGREAAVLVNEYNSAGSYEVKFNASGLSSGVYFCRMESGGKAESIKLTLLK